ncbi:MAG: diguanylate cyclase [Gluconacetobacter sp.]
MAAYAPVIIGYSTTVALLIGFFFLVSGRSGGFTRALWLASPFLLGGIGGAVLAVPGLLPRGTAIPAGAFFLTLAYGFGWQAIRAMVGLRPRAALVMLACLAPFAPSWFGEPTSPDDVGHVMSRLALVAGFNGLAARDVWRACGRTLPAARNLIWVLGLYSVLECLRLPFTAWLPQPLGARPTALWAVVAFNAQAMIEVLLVTVLMIALPRERLAAEHLRLARRDPLTGLGNRRALEDWRASRDGDLSNIAVMIFDLDRFKLINDTYGHATGDRYLVAAAEAARRVLPAGDTLFRVGGDEFVGIFPGTSEEDLQGLASRLQAAFESETRVLGVPASLSAGGAVSQNTPLSLETLLARADAALYEVKRAHA